MSELTAKQIEPELTEGVSVFGYELIREVLLHDLLGPDGPEILYWAGKRLARKYPLESVSDIISFFQKASWGRLSIVKETKDELTFELSGSIIEKRMKDHAHFHCKLEAGFIAQQIESQKGFVCEAFEHPRKRSLTATFTVKWDPKDTAWL
jgi:predicted hydrocarbon binding protein